MTRSQLEHAIRAVADITNETELIVIGSQAILGQYPNAPEELLISAEVDIYAPRRPDLSDVIDGALGEMSRFERIFDFRVDGVSPTTATLPGGWETRLFPICNTNTNWATGRCLECHDIAIAKYVAGRDKDLRYIRDLWGHGLIDHEIYGIEVEPDANQRRSSPSARQEDSARCAAVRAWSPTLNASAGATRTNAVVVLRNDRPGGVEEAHGGSVAPAPRLVSPESHVSESGRSSRSTEIRRCPGRQPCRLTSPRTHRGRIGLR